MRKKVMDAHDEATARQVGGDDAITTRIGAAALPLGVVVVAVSEYFHPSREDPMNNPAVFMEYAQSNVWTAVHLAEYFGFLLLIGGLVALSTPYVPSRVWVRDWCPSPSLRR